MTVKEFIAWLEKQNKPEDAETLGIVKELYERDLKSKKSKEMIKVKWRKINIGSGDIYDCYVNVKKVILRSENGKWKLSCDDLCQDIELARVISAKRPMTYYEAQKAALGFIAICAEEEIKTLQNVIKDCRGD